MTREDLLDALAELKHDLGKYIFLPIAFLPDEANDEDVRSALETALLRTRVTPRGVRSASDIWNSFTAECRESLATVQSFEELQRVVVRALLWNEQLCSCNQILDRDRLRADLGDVSPAIALVMEEVERGQATRARY